MWVAERLRLKKEALRTFRLSVLVTQKIESPVGFSRCLANVLHLILIRLPFPKTLGGKWFLIFSVTVKGTAVTSVG